MDSRRQTLRHSHEGGNLNTSYLFPVIIAPRPKKWHFISMTISKNILVAGAGKIGCALSAVLASQEKTQITLVDKHISGIPNSLRAQERIEICQCDVSNAIMLFKLIKQKSIDAIVSCLPYFCNFSVAEVAKANHCHYFDLTEDVDTTRDIFALSDNADTAFVPQCGIAPGFINIVAGDFIRHCNTVNSVKLYCGALPQKIDNALGYALTWSTDGLINEYVNLCRIIQNGKLTSVPGLSDCEALVLNDETYEAFHTSGGIGTLIDSFKDHIQAMHYKTIRYPGHCEKMQFLMQDLKLAQDRKTLKKILEKALPTTTLDVVIAHVCVQGQKNNQPIELTDTRHFYPTVIADLDCTAIQAVTSIGATVVIDTVLSNPKAYQGPIKQEDFLLDTILNSSLAAYLKTGK